MNNVSANVILENVEISKEISFTITPASPMTDQQLDNLCKRILRGVPT